MSISALWLKLPKTLALLERLVLEVSSHSFCPGAFYPLAGVYHTLRSHFCDKLNKAESAQSWSHPHTLLCASPLLSCAAPGSRGPAYRNFWWLSVKPFDPALRHWELPVPAAEGWRWQGKDRGVGGKVGLSCWETSSPLHKNSSIWGFSVSWVTDMSKTKQATPRKTQTKIPLPIKCCSGVAEGIVN